MKEPRKYHSAAHYATNILLLLKHMGFVVIPVADGLKRDNVSRAIYGREIKRRIKQANIVKARCQLYGLYQRLTDNKLTGNENEFFEKEKGVCIKVIKLVNNLCIISMPNKLGTRH